MIGNMQILRAGLCLNGLAVVAVVSTVSLAAAVAVPGAGVAGTLLLASFSVVWRPVLPIVVGVTSVVLSRLVSASVPGLLSGTVIMVLVVVAVTVVGSSTSATTTVTTARCAPASESTTVTAASSTRPGAAPAPSTVVVYVGKASFVVVRPDRIVVPGLGARVTVFNVSGLPFTAVVSSRFPVISPWLTVTT